MFGSCVVSLLCRADVMLSGWCVTLVLLRFVSLLCLCPVVLLYCCRVVVLCCCLVVLSLYCVKVFLRCGSVVMLC